MLAEYWTQWGAETNALLELVLVVVIPALLATLVGSTVLGVVLLGKGFSPRPSALLLAATFPLALVIPMVTSLGNVVLPIAFAFGLAGRELAREGRPAYATDASPAQTR